MTAKEVWEAMRPGCLWYDARYVQCDRYERPCAFDACPLLKVVPVGRENVKEIMEQWLRDRDYDGLYNGVADCACLLSDLRPCDGDISACVPGYKAPCDCGEHNFHIQSEKPKEG
jgi:hypothetical protein